MVDEKGGHSSLGWIVPIAIGGLLSTAVVAAILVSGRLDLTATTPDSPVLGKIIHGVFRRATAVQSADVIVPSDLADPSRIAIGAGHFANVCANCHGAPGFGQSPSALGMSPRPPWLPGQINGIDNRALFWVIKHGVKLSAMPGWTSQNRDDEVWSMVAFVRTLPMQTDTTFRRLVTGDAEGPASAAMPLVPFGQPSTPQPYASFNSDIPQFNVNRFMTPAWGPADFARDSNPLLTCARCHGVAGRGGPRADFPT